MLLAWDETGKQAYFLLEGRKKMEGVSQLNTKVFASRNSDKSRRWG